MPIKNKNNHPPIRESTTRKVCTVAKCHSMNWKQMVYLEKQMKGARHNYQKSAVLFCATDTKQIYCVPCKLMSFCLV